MRTTKTAKASIIRIAPPIVEEPSESLEPLKELFEKEETAYRLSFTKSMETGIYASYRSIKECAFSNITFIDSAFKSAQISDVVFRQCDFSNISFAGSSFYRVEFIDCKLMGTNFGESTFNHVRMINCNSRYINLAMSKTNQMQFSRCDLQNGSLNDCRLQATAIRTLFADTSRLLAYASAEHRLAYFAYQWPANQYFRPARRNRQFHTGNGATSIVGSSHQ